MKKIFLAASVVFTIVALSTGCKKDKIFGGIEVALDTVRGVIPPVPIVLPPGFPTPPLTIHQHFSLDSLIRANTNNDFSAGDVSSVLIKNITITVLDPTPVNNISSVESARFEFFSNANTTPIELANVSIDTAYASTISFPGDESKQLRPYLDGTELTYNIYARNRRIITDSMHVVITAKMLAK